MKIYPTILTPGTLEITELFEIAGTAGVPTNLNVGVAGFPDGLRHPAEGMAAHDQDEISIILDGSFLLETKDGEHLCKSGDVIHIPAGEDHASTAQGNSKVFYVLFGENYNLGKE